jgi:hypothetical protein
MPIIQLVEKTKRDISGMVTVETPLCKFWKVYFHSTVQGVSDDCKQYEEETADDRNDCYDVRLPSCI